MAARSPEELDRMEEKRQRNLAKARSNLRGVALLFVALALLVVWIAGYSSGSDYGKATCAGNGLLTRRD